MAQDSGAGEDRSRRDRALEAVEQLIEEASASPHAEDTLRLKGLLDLRAALLAGRRAKPDNPRVCDE